MPCVPLENVSCHLWLLLRLTSPAALAIAGQASRRQPNIGLRLSAAEVASVLADRLQSGWGLPLSPRHVLHAIGGGRLQLLKRSDSM